MRIMSKLQVPPAPGFQPSFILSTIYLCSLFSKAQVMITLVRHIISPNCQVDIKHNGWLAVASAPAPKCARLPYPERKRQSFLRTADGLIFLFFPTPGIRLSEQFVMEFADNQLLKFPPKSGLSLQGRICLWKNDSAANTSFELES